jgi:pimeloyl-ACP methyl ester carboxylesterase
VAGLPDARFITLGDVRLEYRWWGPPFDAATTFVLLHEGLGCAGAWGEFPRRLAAATGCGIVAYSRAGYGGSSSIALPRPLDYMQREAVETLPRVLDAIGFASGGLVGHSDGASIAAVHAGAVRDPRVRAVSLIAPHFVVEDVTIAAIERARAAYRDGDLRARLARWHADVDVAFRGWNDAWLDPKFRAFDITGHLRDVTIPVQIIQGGADPYGGERQIDAARAALRAPPNVTRLPGIGHAPHREALAETVEAIRRFALPLL